MNFRNLKIAAAIFLFATKMVGQTLKIVPPSSDVVFCDTTDNDPALWNKPTLWDTTNWMEDLCETSVHFSIQASKINCPGPAHWSFRLSIDQNGNGTPLGDTVITGFPFVANPVLVKTSGNFSIAKIKFPASFTLPLGHHSIKWKVAACGLVDSLEYGFEVRDCKPPVVVCINGLSVNQFGVPFDAMPSGVTLWATDF